MSLLVDIEKKLGAFTLHAQFETSGGIMALLGASGSDKSVTLKCITGIMTPDRGRIVLDGKTLFDSEARVNLTPQQRRVGYLFQQYALFPNMTVMQNILCGVRSGTKAERRRKVQDSLRRFRLEGLEKKYPAQFSGGQQQRVALARILVSEPQTILLDEPFSALDSFLKWNLELELSDLLPDFQNPILWGSHDLGECYRNCQTVCVMENGRSGAVLDMKELAHHPTMQGAARLTSCRNFLPARACAGGVEPEGWNIVLPLEAPAQRVTVAIGIGPHEARVLRVISDLNSTVLLLRPAGTADAPLLRAVAPKDAQVQPGRTVHFSLQTDKCLCYNT